MFNPLKILKGKTSEDNAYIGVLFKEQEGVVFYFQVAQGVMQITQQEQFRYSDGWEHLVDDVDDVLYRLEQRTKLAPHKSIMFIYSHLIDKQTNQIRKPYLQKIKDLSKNLDLNPMGFIECHEAVLDLIASQSVKESASLIFEIDQTVITVILSSSYGKELIVRSVARSGNVQESILGVLEELATSGPLPSSIYAYCSRGVEEEVTGLMRESWNPDLFSVRPTVHIIQERELFSRLVMLFGKQVLSLPPQSTVTQPVTNVSAAPVSVSSVQEHDNLLNDDEFFDDEHDMSESSPQEEEVMVKAKPNPNPQPKSVMGFTMGSERDVLGKTVDGGSRSDDIFDDDVYQQVTKDRPSGGSSRYMNSVMSFITSISHEVKKYIGTYGKAEHKGTIFLGAGVVFVILVFAVLEYGFHKATIQLTMPSQIINDEVSVPQNELGLQEKELKTSLQAQVAATGVKNIGDKAKGSVTIYNSSLSDSKTFKQGTQITSPGGLVFTFDNEVKVASASGDASSITSSTAKVSVTAANLGGEYNLGAGTKFSVDNESSSVIAKNDASFSGGSKKQIKAVSKEDIASLYTKLSAQAVEYTKSHAKTSSSSEKVLDSLTKSTLSNEKYSKDVGDEADSVSATADASILYAVYAQSTVDKIFTAKLQKKTNPGLSIQPESIQATIKPTTTTGTKKTNTKDTEESSDVLFTVKARAVKRIDTASAKKLLLGKNLRELNDVVKNTIGAQGYEVVQNSQIPFLSQWAPFVRSNLTVQIRY